ncbi:FecCD family ABC transporter permease [Desulfuribacillus alkaliarsenatis]|uniref:Iron ABC transporter permease n=1 Tax=Desulfuribacillus alkaliarsenatis TaxID=766136 RepID=A0A1E5G2V0_9FIRM|nr:iron ABC transporter permease [Desulfuribacillus alkaliarsenatis]OEF97397.1 iron ABC transporter permease [Desulfuribacillus alkaliarsenatis]
MSQSTYTTLRLKRLLVSFQVQTKALWIMIALSLFLLGLMTVSLKSGTTDVSFERLVWILLGHGNSVENFSVLTLRLPRILLGVLVGVGLALAGAILQGMIRNPLASPDVIGVNSGASLMAVIFITLLYDRLNIHFLPLFAFAGALLVVATLYALAWKNGVTPFRLILVGFGITAMLGAIQTILMISSDIARSASAYTWLTGSLHATKWYEVQIVFGWMLVLIPALIFLVSSLNLQQVSDDITVSLGGRLQFIRFGTIGIAACLAGISVAFAGGIGFIGLMAPHIARKLVGTSYGQLLPCAALVGAILVVLSDWIGRTWFAPLDIAAGVFTALIGAPFFLYLFVRMRNK